MSRVALGIVLAIVAHLALRRLWDRWWASTGDLPADLVRRSY